MTPPTIIIKPPSEADESRDSAGLVDEVAVVEHSKPRRIRWAILAVLLAAAVAGIASRWASEEAAPAVTTLPTSTLPPDALSVEVYRQILPSTVTVLVTRDVDAQDAEANLQDAEESAASGLGSGVVLDDQGSILTALHVVDGATEIQVRFADGTVASAQVVDALPDVDMAVLKPSGLPQILVPAVLGNPGALRIGDEAFVVGNPLGLTASLSSGVISGLDRSSVEVSSGVAIDGLIQFDTAVNPGSSGGPLLNRRGEVVGVVTGLVNPSGDESFSGIGFAAVLPGGNGGLGPGQ